MVFQKIFYTSCLLAVAIFSLGNSGGRAADANRGNTGAPGDEINTNGTFRTCQSCHNGGPITCAMSIEMINTNQFPVTSYIPGNKYTVRVTITSGSAGVQGYGFQMIPLKVQGNTDVKGFTDLGVNNYKISTLTNGRTYAEHNGVSGSNTFDVEWTAPAAGTGTVRFYSSANAVNNNGITSGDGATITTFDVTETPTISTTQPGSEVLSLKPLGSIGSSQTLSLSITAAQAGAYQMEVIGLDGRIAASQKGQLMAGEQTISLDATDWSHGIFFVRLKQMNHTLSTKVVKCLTAY